MTKIDAAITDNDNKFIESIDARTSIADNNVDVDADTVPVDVRSLFSMGILFLIFGVHPCQRKKWCLIGAVPMVK